MGEGLGCSCSLSAGRIMSSSSSSATQQVRGQPELPETLSLKRKKWVLACDSKPSSMWASWDRKPRQRGRQDGGYRSLCPSHTAAGKQRHQGALVGGSCCVRVVCLPFLVPQYSRCTPILSHAVPPLPKVSLPRALIPVIYSPQPDFLPNNPLQLAASPFLPLPF